MSSVHRFSWMILEAGRRSPTAAGSSLPVERRGQVSNGAQFLAVVRWHKTSP